MAKTIMLQGTSSHVGKSILATALCRIFFQDGLRVVPFKAQNMALNSYVTKAGGEMGRAQVAQAEAAGLEPTVEMNPVLLKPTGNSTSQVVVMGRPVKVMSAGEYHHGYNKELLGVIETSLRKLQAEYDMVVIEGAGSPAEVNLKDNDIVNMRIAKMAGAPVLLIADIDRGGALAAVVGTLELLEPEERDLVKGIIINKFRGDRKLLEPALDFLQAKTGKPVVGVVPHISQLGIDEEDSVSLDEKVSEEGDIEIVVLRTPRISNFTDFDALANEAGVSLTYIRQGEAIGRPDMVILPGTKNTVEDFLYLKAQGYDRDIINLAAQGTPVIGICGGYQMLGRELRDPEHNESDLEYTEGLGLLDIATTFTKEKTTHQVTAVCLAGDFLDMGYNGSVTGYEIHMGRTESAAEVKRAFTVTERSGRTVADEDGVLRSDGLILGTYIHGIFDNDDFRQALLNALRKRKGLPERAVQNVAARKEASYNKLAEAVRSNLDMPYLYRIIGDVC
ncbi:MAG: Cobyric acid synthase [Firmicutes bacterium]|nr:Cobyric acid synthase [Bacillota bacterium]